MNFHIQNPPNVPEKNPAAAYGKEFNFAVKDGKCYELHFEGNYDENVIRKEVGKLIVGKDGELKILFRG